MKGVKRYELFGGISLKNHTFSFFFICRDRQHVGLDVNNPVRVPSDILVTGRSIKTYQSHSENSSAI